jgi:methyl-accepting chemotaxis protein
MLAAFGFRKKLMSLGIALTVIPILLITGIVRMEYKAIQARATIGTSELATANLVQLADATYTMVDTNRSLLDHQIEVQLQVAREQLDRMGQVTLDPAQTVSWNARDQLTNRETGIRLPRLRIGGQWLGQISDPGTPVALVDEIHRVSGAASTVFHRMNDAGDMLRVATTVIGKNGKRAVGTFIPAVNQDGSPNPVIASVLSSKIYIGRAFVVDSWYTAGYAPLSGPAGDVEGMLFVGTPESLATDRLRRELASRTIGRTGYIFVLNATGKTRGQYVVSRAGKRDGENLWDARDAKGNYVIRRICERAQSLGPREVAAFRYTWQNPGDPLPSLKIAYLKYYKPWDWVIGVSAPASELSETTDAIAALASHGTLIIWLILLLSCAGSAGAWWLASRVLMGRITPVVAGLLASANEVSTAAAQSSRGGESLLQTVQQSSAATANVTASLEIVSAMTRANQECAARAESLAAGTHSSITEGAQAVEVLASVMGDIQTSNNEVAAVLKTIDGVAFQTNLLALNAAVEAARAGDTGLSFGIVAQEVRALAQRCADAAHETATKIERSKQSGADAAADTVLVTGRLAEILRHSRELNQLVAGIAASSRRQSAGIAQIETALHHIDTAAGATSTNAEESALSSTRLTAEAARLNRLAGELSALMNGLSSA